MPTRSFIHSDSYLPAEFQAFLWNWILRPFQYSSYSGVRLHLKLSSVEVTNLSCVNFVYLGFYFQILLSQLPRILIQTFLCWLAPLAFTFQSQLIVLMDLASLRLLARGYRTYWAALSRELRVISDHHGPTTSTAFLPFSSQVSQTVWSIQFDFLQLENLQAMGTSGVFYSSNVWQGLYCGGPLTFLLWFPNKATKIDPEDLA